MFPSQGDGRVSVLEDGTLLIASVSREDAGEYLCKGLSIAGTAVAKVLLEVLGNQSLVRACIFCVYIDWELTCSCTCHVFSRRFTTLPRRP